MKVVHIDEGKETLTVLPAAPKHLSRLAKNGWAHMGQLLIKANRLKVYHLPLLEIFADGYAQFQAACIKINEREKMEPGSGFVQVFTKTGAEQLGPWVTLKERGATTMMQTSKLFGLDPKSEKELKAAIDNSQMSFMEYDEFYKEGS